MTKTSIELAIAALSLVLRKFSYGTVFNFGKAVFAILDLLSKQYK